MKILYYFRMIGLVIFFFSFVAFANETKEFKYRIKYLAEVNPNCLDITIGFKANSTGETLLYTPKYYSGGISFSTMTGDISHSQLDNRKILIRSEPNVNIEANYKGCIANENRNNNYPIIEKDFFYFLSEDLLIFPADSLQEKITSKVCFEGFPQNHTIITNHFVNKREYEVNSTVRSLCRSIMAGGKFDVETKYIKNKPVHVVLNGKWTMFKNTELKNILYKIIDKQRIFMRDNDFPHFVLIIYDNNQLEGGGVSGSLNESVLTMLIIGGEEKNKPMLYGLFSHELFHAWIAGKIKIPQPQGNLQWFFEGVNDFYAWQLAKEMGIVTDSQYIEYYNRVIQEYELSPHKIDSNEMLAKGFDLRNFAGRLAMFRGHIVFMEILNELKNQKKDRSYIDQALYEIVEKYSNKDRDITLEELDHIFRKHLGDQIWAKASKTLYDGEPISFSPKLFSNNIVLNDTLVAVPHFGFDVLESVVKQKRIISLEKNSNAFLAGLKENDKILGCGLDIAKPTVPVQMEIEDSGKQKFIQFMPQTVEKNIPQYRILGSQIKARNAHFSA